MTVDRRAPVVVKVGGSLAREPRALRRLLETIAATPAQAVVVPGGGALADAVRALHARGELTEETAHQMALLAMDQMALWLAELAGGPEVARVARTAAEVADTLAGGALTIVAPASWLSDEEPLPASWRVTSDSIAAWLAGRIGARRLLLLKSFSFEPAELPAENLRDDVDPHFLHALPRGVECRLLDGRDSAAVAAVLAGGAAGTRLVGTGKLGYRPTPISR